MVNNINLPNIEVKGIKKGKPKLKSNGYVLPLYKNKKKLSDLDYYNKFIKNIEDIIRGSKEYKAYKKDLMENKGLNHCMVFPNINQEIDKKITIEMHHGPILTLYDYCDIVIKWCLHHDINIASTTIFKIIMDEHFNNNIQVVMLCDLAHKLFHAGQIYINPKQAWGHLDIFIEKYKDGIDKKMEKIIDKNLEIGRTTHSFDKNGILTFNGITRYDNREE